MKPNKTTPAALLLTLVSGTTQTLSLDLGCLNGQDGFVINGVDEGDVLGRYVSGAGDINGDGVDDIIIGAIAANPGGGFSTGAAYVLFGGSDLGKNGSVELDALNGANGFLICNAGVYEGLGSGVSSAGDMNGDGFCDLLVGSPTAGPNGLNSGKVYVIYGNAQIGNGGVLDIQLLDSNSLLAINGIGPSHRIGSAISSVGDINEDGYMDVLLGSSEADPNGIASGQAYLVFGGESVGNSGVLELSSLNGTGGIMINGAAAFDRFGGAVSGGGDINNDGVSDVIIGARYEDTSADNAGSLYVILGGKHLSEKPIIELSGLDGKNGFVMYGELSGDECGVSVSAEGDINGDGIDDLLAGAWRAGNSTAGSGKTYIIYGHSGVGETGAASLAALDGSTGFVCEGVNYLGSSGYSVSAVGDMNGDGLSDIIIGAHGESPSGEYSGRTYIVFGRSAQAQPSNIMLQDTSTAEYVVLNGASARDYSGVVVSGAGDFNGDGLYDALIGASLAGPNGYNSGAAYLIFGSPTLGQTIPQDLNANGCVNSADLAILLAAWATPDADLNADGTTNSADLAILLAAWTG